MEEKVDCPAENELPLFSGEDAENIVETVPENPEPVQVAVPATAVVPEETPVAEMGSVPEQPVVEETPVPVQEFAVSSASGNGTKIPPGVVPSPAFGSFLRRVREANGISLDELARTTRIKRGYLDAVEQENYKELPAVVYALAYINTLADYYGVDAEGKAVLTSEVRKHLEYEAPEENKTVVGYEPSEDNPILLRRIMFAGAGLIVLLAVLITLAVLYFTSGGSSGGDSDPVQGGAPAGLDEAQLVEMQPAPSLKTHVLPVPKR